MKGGGGEGGGNVKAYRCVQREGVKKQRFYSMHTLWINPNGKRMN